MDEEDVHDSGGKADDPIWADFVTAYMYAAVQLDRTGTMGRAFGRLFISHAVNKSTELITKEDSEITGLVCKLAVMEQHGMNDAEAGGHLMNQVMAHVTSQGLDPIEEETPVAHAQRAVSAFNADDLVVRTRDRKGRFRRPK